MKFFQSLDLPRADIPPQLREERTKHQPPAHADTAMDSSLWDFDAFGAKRLVPGRNVLIVTVHKRPVEIEKDRRDASFFAGGWVGHDAMISCEPVTNSIQFQGKM